MEDVARGKHRRGSTVQRPDSLRLEVEETEQLAVREEERGGIWALPEMERRRSGIVRNASPRRLCGTLTGGMPCVGAAPGAQDAGAEAKNVKSGHYAHYYYYVVYK